MPAHPVHLLPLSLHDALPIFPDGLSDEEVLMCPDIMSTGFAGAESGGIRIGDTVAVFAQGPIGLCATVGAKRSEEHTSELQSLRHLVCRLLPEKKNSKYARRQ